MKRRDLEAQLIQKEKRTGDEGTGTGYNYVHDSNAQMDVMMNPLLQIYHGPDSIAHLDEFLHW